MRRLPVFGPAALAGAWLLLTIQPGLANSFPARVPLPACVVLADCIVLGTVTAIEQKPVLAPPFPGSTAQIEYRIAVVKIEEDLKNPRGLATVRIAFQPPLPPAPKPVERPGLLMSSSPPPFPRKTLALGTEGCFLLKRQGDESFYRLVDSTYNDYLGKGDGDFGKKMTVVKRSLKLLADPDTSLRSKDAADRLLTASLLLTRYQADARPGAKAEPINAAQSKLILEAIASADWSQTDTMGDLLTPQRVFMALRLTPTDGWTAPQQKPNQDIRLFMKEWEAAAQKWLKDNSATYRIQRWVSAK